MNYVILLKLFVMETLIFWGNFKELMAKNKVCRLKINSAGGRRIENSTDSHQLYRPNFDAARQWQHA